VGHNLFVQLNQYPWRGPSLRRRHEGSHSSTREFAWKTTKALDGQEKQYEAGLNHKSRFVWAGKLTLEWRHHIPEVGKGQSIFEV